MPRMTNARARFLGWQQWLGFTVGQMSGLCGCSKTTIVYLRGGQRCPGRALAARIEIASASWPKGPIKLMEWYCNEEEEEEEAA